MNRRDGPTSAHEARRYELRVRGHLDARWTSWFEGLGLAQLSDGTTAIHGTVADQAALHGLLQKLRDLGLPIVSVAQTDPDEPHPIPADNHKGDTT